MGRSAEARPLRPFGPPPHEWGGAQLNESGGVRLNIAIIGGGPAGLYLATLAKLLNSKHRIEVWERNAADDTFGFGVVSSDETLSGIENADSAFYERLTRSFAVWDDIDVHFKQQVLTSGGHGFAAISRQRLLAILRERCEEFGVDIHYREPAPELEELRRSHDLVVGAGGGRSLGRNRRPPISQTPGQLPDA